MDKVVSSGSGIDITSFGVGYIADKSVDIACDRLKNSFKKYVVEPWSNHRATIFFESLKLAFEEERNNKNDPVNLELCIEKTLKNQRASELLFEAYRRLIFSRSKDIAPKVVAFLTVRIISEDRNASEAEEMIFQALENLYDRELIAFSEFIVEHNKKVNDPKSYYQKTIIDNAGALRIEWRKSQNDSNGGSFGGRDISPINFNNEIGVWASKLKTYGVIEEEILEDSWDYEADSERYVDEAGSVIETRWIVVIEEAFLEFASLIDRFSPIEINRANAFSY